MKITSQKNFTPLTFMLIDQIFPQFVSDRATLRERLVDEAISQGIENEAAKRLITLLPPNLLNAECFLDKLTGLWRYEFGLPYDIGADQIWGTHMWIPVKYLVVALSCVELRLGIDKRSEYMARLAEPARHQITLVEMIPVSKLDTSIPASFEIAGIGNGNRTIDWDIGPFSRRTVLMDVKRRTRDFIEQAERTTDQMNEMPEPKHKPEIMFRSVEQKFVSVDPKQRLQGVWIVTDIQQDEEAFKDHFNALDPTKVHFAILGDWKSDAFVLTRSQGDERFLRELFKLQPSNRFTF